MTNDMQLIKAAIIGFDKTRPHSAKALSDLHQAIVELIDLGQILSRPNQIKLLEDYARKA